MSTGILHQESCEYMRREKEYSEKKDLDFKIKYNTSWLDKKGITYKARQNLKKNIDEIFDNATNYENFKENIEKIKVPFVFGKKLKIVGSSMLIRARFTLNAYYKAAEIERK